MPSANAPLSIMDRRNVFAILRSIRAQNIVLWRPHHVAVAAAVIRFNEETMAIADESVFAAAFRSTRPRDPIGHESRAGESRRKVNGKRFNEPTWN